MTYRVVIDPMAIRDIQQAIDYYDEQQPGLGEKFENTLNNHLLILETNPYFRVRYSNIHCLPLRKFPYMLHFTINKENKLVNIMAVFHQSRKPGNLKSRP